MLDKLEQPLEIYVEPSHPDLISNPLKNTEDYMPLKTDYLADESSHEMLRVKDNVLAREVLTERKLNVLDDRVKVATLNQGDLKVVGTSKAC